MNLALLAKQGWRIMTQQASLLYKVPKGRYFKRSSFLNAKVGSNPSFGWRSILEGRKLLLKGIRWRVRDGRSVDIWKDPWVPRNLDFRMGGGGGSRVDELKWVSQLIRGGRWDESKVMGITSDEDAKAILAIPLSRVPTRDKIIWHYTKCRNYITSSGYWCAKEMKKNGVLRKNAEGGGEQGGIFGPLLEECVEIISAPPVKTFLWKCLHNILPTRDRLRRKGVIVESTCVLCNNDCENLTHLMATCPISSRGPWSSLGRGAQPCGVFLGGTTACPIAATKEGKWMKLGEGHVKVNVNAAYLKETKTGAVGVVRRESTGAFLGAAFNRLPYNALPLLAECKVARAGI
ncbi:hypothetical protein LIER_22446 [Lithospermum erythrorhizon]|uniref:Reverse transcriptase zinc-binding domain-containing protein n=1 Tax=Lithospermum erythrorhizon TaxID=34254 RepID=A0AAV3QWZ0_LITER